MASSDLQFGFKQNLGCNHAVFAFRHCVEYFVTRGSSVYMAALDATKAFDRINHIKLFPIDYMISAFLCILLIL